MYYNKGNEEEGDNYTNLAETASDYDVYLTKELGDDKKGPSLIGINIYIYIYIYIKRSMLLCCTRSVCGRVWFDVYQKNVKKTLVLKPSTSIICSDLGAELAVQS